MLLQLTVEYPYFSGYNFEKHTVTQALSFSYDHAFLRNVMKLDLAFSVRLSLQCTIISQTFLTGLKFQR